MINSGLKRRSNQKKQARIQMLPQRRSIGFYFAGLVLILLLVQRAGFAQDGPVIRDSGQIKGVISKIAFGSCGHQDHDQPVLDTVVAEQPDLFVYLGDNIYGDTTDMKIIDVAGKVQVKHSVPLSKLQIK
jgi:hypothetical protein